MRFDHQRLGIGAYEGDVFLGSAEIELRDGHVYLHDIYVELEHRRQGVAKALIEQIGERFPSLEIHGAAVSEEGWALAQALGLSHVRDVRDLLAT